MKPRFFTGLQNGDGDGSIQFIPGNVKSPIVTPAQYEKPLPKFSKGIPNRGWAGRDDGWGLYSPEMAVRGEGFRGLPLSYRHPRLEALGIRDHKLAVADLMLQALHEGDFTYFAGLAEALKKFEDLDGDATPKPKLEDVVAAIRSAALAADGIPTQRAVFDAWSPTRGNLTKAQFLARDAGLWKKFRDDKLAPIGFQWLPAGKVGRPKKLP